MHGAHFLGLDKSWVAPTGKVADLLVLNGNPLEDIRAHREDPLRGQERHRVGRCDAR